jgi:hypothetical protein
VRLPSGRGPPANLANDTSGCTSTTRRRACRTQPSTRRSSTAARTPEQ